MNLLIDPDLLHAGHSYDRPTALIDLRGATETVYGRYDADPTTGPRCGRCNDLLHLHTWQLIDDGDVIECGRAA